MVGAGDHLGLLRLSTDELPERERLPTFQEVFGRAIAKVDFDPIAGTHLRIQATVRAMPGLGAWIGAFSPIRGQFPPRLSEKSPLGAGLRNKEAGSTPHLS
jgi:hypothetical protein